MRNKLLVAGTLALAMTCTTVFSSITPAVVKAASVSTVQTQTAENSDDYVYCYAGLTWAEYWKAEGVWAAGDTTSSDTADSHGEKDKGAFDAVTRATANHGLHRGSYQCTAVIKTAEGEYSVSHWSSDGKTVYFTDGTSAGWNRGTLALTNGTTQTMTEYDVLGLKYVPVKVKSSDYASFKKKYSVVENNGTLIGGYGEKNLQDYNVTASVDKDTNGLKTAEKQSDGSFTFTQRSNGSSSGIKDKTLKTADLNNMGATVKDASGSYGEFLRVDLTGNYGGLGGAMQAVKWTYYGDDDTYSNALQSYGTKFAADNWMHKFHGIQLALTDSVRCKLPADTDGTGYWEVTVYGLGYSDYTFRFQATDENIAKPAGDADSTPLKNIIAEAKALKEADYTPDSWDTLVNELEECEDMLANIANQTQYGIEEQIGHLREAIDSLVKAEFKLNQTSATLYSGAAVTLSATTNLTGDITWKSSDAKVATVDAKGNVKAVNAGTATITATLGKVSATFTVTVKNPSITAKADSSVIYTKSKTTTKINVAKDGVTGNATFRSSNKKVATVSANGIVKAKKAGKVNITVQVGNHKQVVKITVKKPTMKLTKASAKLKKGKKVTIKVKAAPVSKVTFKSSNKKVATVSSKGVVKAKKKGTATITVKCNGITRKFKITVK